MWRQVVFKVSCLLVVASMHLTLDQPTVTSPSGVNCVDYSEEKLATILKEGWRSLTPIVRRRRTLSRRSLAVIPTQFTTSPTSRPMDALRIIDNLIPRGDYLVKEHAKLVRDINSLSQVVWVRPVAEEPKDYDDLVFHEIIETTTAIKPSPSSVFTSTVRPISTTSRSSSIPVILAGGPGQRHLVKSHPINFAKPTISLVGTTISPVVKHPYPFVMHRPPTKICVTALPQIITPKPPITATLKTIWERVLDYFLPGRHILGLGFSNNEIIS